MNSLQIITVALLLVIVILKARKYFLTRSLKNYTAGELSKKIQTSKNFVILDVRMDYERKSGYIKNSIHIPLFDIVKRQNELKKYAGKETIASQLISVVMFPSIKVFISGLSIHV